MNLIPRLLHWAIRLTDRRIERLNKRLLEPGLAPWTEGAVQVDIAEAHQFRAWLVKRLGSHGGQP
jgi:hypothetical protein